MKQTTCLFYLIFATGLWAAPKPIPKFVSGQIAKEGDGYKFILKFAPSIPSTKTVHSKEENASEIRWNARADEKIFRTYNFNNDEVAFKRVTLWVDPKSGKGLIQLYHRGNGGMNVLQRTAQELVITLRGPDRIIASVPQVPSVPVLPPSKKINLSVKEAPLGKLLRTLAAESEKNIVFGSEVDGQVTVNVKDMNYEQAIDTILKPTKYRAEYQKDATIIRGLKDGKSFRMFRLNYVDVNPVLKQVQDMSKDAAVSIDANTNSLFVTDTVETLNAIERMVAAIDKPPRQVEVETALIELTNTNQTDVGFNIEGLVASGTDMNSQVQNEIASKRISPFDPDAPTPKGMFVGLTWKSVRGILGMLNQNSKLTVLARPRVVALNDQEANIVIGSKIGYKTLTVSSTGTVEDVKFLTVGTQLKIKPHITESSDILMAIKPEISDGSLDPTTRIPSEKTTSSETKVLAKDGQTIVIGGLLRDRTEKQETKVPILGDIPVLGFFFKGTTEAVQKGEIIILLSPRLVDDKVMTEYDRERSNAMTKIYDRRINSMPPPKRTGD